MISIKNFLFLTLVSTSAAAAIKGTAEFLAKATPGFLEIEGEKAPVDTSAAKLENGVFSGLFSVKVADLKTGLDERDGHMRKYLDADKYPTIEFKLNPVPMAAGNRKAFTGELTLHGVTKPVSGIVEFGSTKATARFTVSDISQYNVKTPSYKLLTVGKSIDVEINLNY